MSESITIQQKKHTDWFVQTQGFHPADAMFEAANYLLRNMIKSRMDDLKQDIPADAYQQPVGECPEYSEYMALLATLQDTKMKREYKK